MEAIAAVIQHKTYQKNKSAAHKLTAHINELIQNLNKLKPLISEEYYFKLLFMIHTHDCFKTESLKDVDVEHPRSHSFLAKQFASQFTQDQAVLQVILFHSLSKALWKHYNKHGSYDKARLELVLNDVGDVNLLLLFTIIDGFVKGKDYSKVTWFCQEVQQIVPSTTFDERWISPFVAV